MVGLIVNMCTWMERCYPCFDLFYNPNCWCLRVLCDRESWRQSCFRLKTATRTRKENSLKPQSLSLMSSKGYSIFHIRLGHHLLARKLHFACLAVEGNQRVVRFREQFIFTQGYVGFFLSLNNKNLHLTWILCQIELSFTNI